MRYYLCLGATNMCKGINGERRLMKLLHAEAGGMVVYVKRLEVGNLLIDNNLAEDAIRPISLGRKNFLFCGNYEAAGNMAVICSLLGT